MSLLLNQKAKPVFGSGLVGRLSCLMIWMFLLCGFLTGLPGQVLAYEWIDQVQDQTPLQISMEILHDSLSDRLEDDAVGYYDRLERDWFLRKRYIAIGDQKVGKVLLDDLYEQTIDLGVVRLRSYTASLLREAVTLSESEQFDQAISRCKAALSFSPGLPEAHKTLAKIYWRQSCLNVFSAISEWLKALGSVTNSFDHTVLFLMNLNLLVLIAVILFFGIFYLVQLIRNFPLLQHDLYEILPGEPHRLWVAVTVFLCLVIPLLFGWELYSLFLFWTVLFWSYSGRRERIVHLVFILFIAVASLWIGFLKQGMEVLYSDRIQAVIRHQEGLSEDASIQNLSRLASQYPNDDSIFFMLGTAYKKVGENKKAVEAFKKGISLQPDEPIYFNNLGNAYYAERDLERAIRMYVKAIALNPEAAAVHFNLSAAYREQFMLSESDREYFKARELDPAMISYYANIIGSSYNRMVIDESLSMKWLGNRFVDQVLFVEQEDSSLSHSWRDDLGWSIPFVLFVFILLIHFVRSRFGIARRCVKCGMIFCKRCQTTIRPDSVCSQCVYVFEEQEGVDVKHRTKKIIEIRQDLAQKLERGRLLGVLIPGGGHIYYGWMFTGFAVIFAVVSCLVYGFFWGLLAQDPLIYHTVIWSGRIWLLVPAILFYGLSLMHLYRLKG